MNKQQTNYQKTGKAPQKVKNDLEKGEKEVYETITLQAKPMTRRQAQQKKTMRVYRGYGSSIIGKKEFIAQPTTINSDLYELNDMDE